MPIDNQYYYHAPKLGHVVPVALIEWWFDVWFGRYGR